MRRYLEYVVTKEITWEASHKLEGAAGMCDNMHGHSYRAQITFRGSNLDDHGFLIDLSVLNKITEALDHKHLNDVVPGNPTMENIAKFIVTLSFDVLFRLELDDVRIDSVMVQESANSWVILNVRESD